MSIEHLVSAKDKRFLSRSSILFVSLLCLLSCILLLLFPVPISSAAFERSFGSLVVYDYGGSCVDGTRVPVLSGSTKYLDIAALLLSADGYANTILSRDGWNGTGGDVEVFVNYCMDGSFREDNSLAIIGLTSDMTETTDVVAHEWYHGVLEFEGLKYESLPTKSLIKSLGDIFAVAVNADPFDDETWIVAGNTDFARDFRDFRHMDSWDEGFSDSHYLNAQIHNHAVYKWITTDLGDNRDRAAEVYYKALDYLNECSNFTMARMAVIMAAEAAN